jgi:hypothetical protein
MVDERTVFLASPLNFDVGDPAKYGDPAFADPLKNAAPTANRVEPEPV